MQSTRPAADFAWLPLPYSGCFQAHACRCCCETSLQGFQMAAALHADAIGRGTVPPLPLHAAPPPPYCLAAAVGADFGAAAAQPAALPAAAAAQQVHLQICENVVEDEMRACCEQQFGNSCHLSGSPVKHGAM